MKKEFTIIYRNDSYCGIRYWDYGSIPCREYTIGCYNILRVKFRNRKDAERYKEHLSILRDKCCFDVLFV